MTRSSKYRQNNKEISLELVSKIIKGDVSAFRQLFIEYWNPLLNFSFEITKDVSLAENVVQDAFLHFWENRDKIDIDKSFKSYLYTITRNKSLNIVKSHAESKKSTEIEFDSIEYLNDDNNSYESKETIDSIMDAVETLPEKSKEIFKMSRFENLTYKEISEILDISIKTVETQMSRSLKKLKTLLAHIISFLIFLKML